MESLFSRMGMEPMYVLVGFTMLWAVILWKSFRKPKADPRDNNYY